MEDNPKSKRKIIPFLSVCILSGVILFLFYTMVKPSVDINSRDESTRDFITSEETAEAPSGEVKDTIVPTISEKFPDGWGQDKTDPFSPTSTKDNNLKATHKYISIPKANSVGQNIGSNGISPGTKVSIVQSKSQGKVSIEKCTIAFSLKDKRGYSYAVMAGHCGTQGQKVYTAPKTDNFSSASYLGRIIKTSNISSNPDGDADWAVVKLNKQSKVPSTMQVVKNRLDLGERPMRSPLCKVGARTGTTCGVKSNQGVVASVSNPLDKNGGKFAVRLDAIVTCALPGDSGGPVYDRNGIVGVTSATSASVDDSKSGKCTNSKSKLFYSPVEEVINQIQREIPEIIIIEKK